MVFNWSGSGAKDINSDIEDTDSGIKEAILQMDVFHLDDDDNDNDNHPAIDDIEMRGLGPSQEVIYPLLILIYSTMLTVIISEEFQ